MAFTQYLKTKLNGYSIIGSLIYGLFCASLSNPEVIAIIGRTACFLSAFLFYFIMYIIYSEHKEFVSGLFKHKLRNIGILVSFLLIVPNTLSFFYMITYNIPFSVAADTVANSISNFFYYIPFLP